MSLGTTYLGFDLPNPLVVGASPLCDDIAVARQLEDFGAAMLVLRSIFQEQIAEGKQFTEASAYLNKDVEFQKGPLGYLGHMARVKSAVRIPVVASLNCQSVGPWIDFVKMIEEAGADALELNIFNPVIRFDQTSEQVEQDIVNTVAAVRAQTQVPLAVKLLQNYTALPQFARRLAAAGANALVLFNRPYQPEMELERLGLSDNLKLSNPVELSSRIRAVAALAGRVRCDLAVTGGAHGTAEVLRATLAGASAVQMVSAILEHGPQHVRRVLEEVDQWLGQHQIDSLSQIRGSMSLLRTPAPQADARGHFVSMINQWPAAGREQLSPAGQ